MDSAMPLGQFQMPVVGLSFYWAASNSNVKIKIESAHRA